MTLIEMQMLPFHQCTPERGCPRYMCTKPLLPFLYKCQACFLFFSSLICGHLIFDRKKCNCFMQFLFFTPTINGILFGKPLMGRISVSQIILTIKFFIYSVVNITIIFILSKSALFAFFAASFQIYKTSLGQVFAQC